MFLDSGPVNSGTSPLSAPPSSTPVSGHSERWDLHVT